MASLPSQHPTLSLHLTDLTLTPLITSSSSRTRLEALTRLVSSAITSQTAAQRANLGRPQRIIVEYPLSGALVLQSFLEPLPPDESSTTTTSGTGDGDGIGRDGESPPDDAGDGTPAAASAGAPVLVGLVVAGSAEEAREARRVAARLERVGREFQKEWVAQTAGVDRDGAEMPE